MRDDIFDEVHLGSRHSSVTIKNYAAPTDESIRILQEMEEKVRSRILTSVQVKDSLIDCVIHHVADPLNLKLKFAVIYSLNGVKHRVNIDTNPFDGFDAVISKLLKAVSEDIAVEILGGPFSGIAAELKRSMAF